MKGTIETWQKLLYVAKTAITIATPGISISELAGIAIFLLFKDKLALGIYHMTRSCACAIQLHMYYVKAFIAYNYNRLCKYRWKLKPSNQGGMREYRESLMSQNFGAFFKISELLTRIFVL